MGLVDVFYHVRSESSVKQDVTEDVINFTSAVHGDNASL